MWSILKPQPSRKTSSSLMKLPARCGLQSHYDFTQLRDEYYRILKCLFCEWLWSRTVRSKHVKHIWFVKLAWPHQMLCFSNHPHFILSRALNDFHCNAVLLLKIWQTQKWSFPENVLNLSPSKIRVCFFMGTDLEKCSIPSLAQQWILCSEWVPSEWESKQLIKT